MRALCPDCGEHHEVVRTLDDGHGESRRDLFQLAPLGACERTWLTDAELLEAHARHGQDAIVQEDEYDVA